MSNLEKAQGARLMYVSHACLLHHGISEVDSLKNSLQESFSFSGCSYHSAQQPYGVYCDKQLRSFSCTQTRTSDGLVSSPYYYVNLPEGRGLGSGQGAPDKGGAAADEKLQASQPRAAGKE